MKSKLLCLFLFICTMAFSQSRKPLQGIVKAGEAIVPGVFVINNKTGDETKTDSRGTFSIKAKPGDKIAVYGNKTETREFVVTAEAFTNMPFVVGVEYKAYELEEVVVDDKEDPYSLGQKGRRAAYTPAERKEFAGAKVGPRFNDPTVQGAAINGDAIINAFTGKRKALKRAVETERKEKMIAAFKGMYDNETLITEYNIPKEYIDGFIYYCTEDKKMAKALETNNTDAVRTLTPQLAFKYVELIHDEK